MFSRLNDDLHTKFILVYHVDKGIYSNRLIDTSSFYKQVSGLHQQATAKEQRGRCEGELLLIPWRDSIIERHSKNWEIHLPRGNNTTNIVHI